jgi:hypothetical protein
MRSDNEEQWLDMVDDQRGLTLKPSSESFVKSERSTMADSCNSEGMPGRRQPQSLTITVDGCAIDRQDAFTSIYAALQHLSGVANVDFEIRDGKHIFYTRPWAVND